MLAVYFFSIITNFIAGLFLISDPQGKTAKDWLSVVLNAITWRKQGVIVLLSAITLLFGIMKLLTVAPGNVKIIGDLFPAIAGIVQGIVLFLVHGISKSDLPQDISTILSFRKIIGYLGMSIACGHLLMPGVLFL